MSEEMTFEQRLQKVQETVEAIGSGKLPLEDSVKEYEAGIAALDQLEKSLEEMKRRITVARNDGTEETFAERINDEDL